MDIIINIKKFLKVLQKNDVKKMIDFVTIYCYNLIMGKKEYVLYTGEKFTVEWYFTIEGKSSEKIKLKSAEWIMKCV